MIIKSPDTEDEFEQIYSLNYKTFVEEIPQHVESENKKLVDPFHEKNNYLIATLKGKIIGMVCFNTQRPFSLDKKKVEIDQYIPQGAKTVEIRLLAVEKEWRKSNIAYKLFKILAKKLIEQGIYMGFISATTRQLELYKKIGFAPFDELVGIDGAFYQPMRITFDNLKKEFKS